MTWGQITIYRNFWRTRTIRNGMVLVVLAALLPMTVLSLLQGVAAWQDTRQLIANQLRAKATVIAEGERDPFVIARYTLLTASRNDAIRTITSECSASLAQGQQLASGVINYARSDAAGRVRCSVIPFDPGQTFADESWWQRGIKIDGVSLSSPTFGRISKRSILIMMLPLTKADGTQDGAITAGISLEALQASLDKRRVINPDALVEIIGSQGEVILSNGAAKLQGVNLLQGANPLTPAKSQDGAEWIYATAPLQGNELFVLYAEPRQSLMSTALWQVRQSLVLPLIAMILATLAIWFGTYWLVGRWLKRLQALAAQFGRGEFASDQSAYDAAPREIAALSHELHTMAAAIETRDTALISALATKTALTREIHHRVKNNLQIVTSLLTLQSDRVDDPWAREVLGQAKARISALGLIHRLLYQQDNNNEMGTVDMRVLTTELCMQLRAAHRSRSDIDLVCECDSIELSVDQAVPLTLFIVESVTNAYRHGFGNGKAGAITVIMIATDGHAELSINDNGNGYVVDNSTAKMGVELMKAFATQLGGILDVTSSQTGTRVALHYG